MGKNPIVPFLLIMALGVGLIFYMSLYGLDQQKEIADKAENGEGTEETSEFDPASFAEASCVSCHGGNLEGGAAPALVGSSLSEEELKDIIVNGTDGGMPGGLVPAGDIDAMVEYIASLK